jgi:hypothetical protein
MSTPATAAATNKSTIKVIAYETSDPEVYAVVFKSVEQKVTETNTCLAVLLDASGSMQMTMGGAAPPAPMYGNQSGASAATPMAASYDQDEEDAQAGQASPMLPALTAQPTVPYSAPMPPRRPVRPVFGGSLAFTPTVPYGAPPPMLPSLQRAYSCGTSATPAAGAYGYDVYGNAKIDPDTRLGAEEAFTHRILDMYEFVEEQGVKQKVAFITFSDEAETQSNLDGLTFPEIRKGVNQALRKNGGTNFDNALQALKKCREKFAEQTDGTGSVIAVFLSDGGHCDTGKTTQHVETEYAESVELAIGIGREQQDFNEKTLRAISKQFHATNDAREMRDLVANLAMNLVTNLGKDITVKTIGDGSHIFYSNMVLAEDEDGNRVCKATNMSFLMEYYMLIKKETVLQVSYTLPSGGQVTEVIDFTEENDNLFGDTSYGDQIKFTVETLEQSDKIPKEIAEMTNPQSKLAYVKEFTDRVRASPHAQAFKGTRAGVYLQHLLSGLERISLTDGDEALLRMAQNVGASAFRSTSSDSATAYTSPMAPSGTPSATPSESSDASPPSGLLPLQADTDSTFGTPKAPLPMLRATSSSTSATYGSMCLICTDPSAHRGVIYNPCGHFRTCNGCTLEWNKTSDKCPYCNGVSTGIILVNLSEEQKKDSWNMKCTTCKKRQIEVVAEECKHVFSCGPCMARQRAQTGKVCCTVCASEGKETEVKKIKKIFM